MATPLRFKVYSPSGDHVSSHKHAEHAAYHAAFLGHGATILAHGIAVWEEGAEAIDASDDPDSAAELIWHRLRKE